MIKIEKEEERRSVLVIPNWSLLVQLTFGEEICYKLGLKQVKDRAN